MTTDADNDAALYDAYHRLAVSGFDHLRDSATVAAWRALTPTDAGLLTCLVARDALTRTDDDLYGTDDPDAWRYCEMVRLAATGRIRTSGAGMMHSIERLRESDTARTPLPSNGTDNRLSWQYIVDPAYIELADIVPLACEYDQCDSVASAFASLSLISDPIALCRRHADATLSRWQRDGLVAVDDQR